jgi:hypothetical protein
MDDLDRMSNFCTDLVSLRRSEPSLASLFDEHLPGQWTAVRSLTPDLPTESTFDQLVATWLPSPADPDYAVILFFDDATKWSMTADYNVARLRRARQQPPVAAAG